MKNMTKRLANTRTLFIAVLIGFVTIFAGCTTFEKSVDYYPALPRESRTADYTPIKPVRKTLKYEMDEDTFFHFLSPLQWIVLGHGAIHDIRYYKVDGTNVTPLFDEKESFEYNHSFKEGTLQVEEVPANISYLIKEIKKEIPEMDVLLNVRIEEKCEREDVGIFFLYGWWGGDNDYCEMELTGIAAQAR